MILSLVNSMLFASAAESSSATMDSLVARTTQLAAELSALQARVSALEAELRREGDGTTGKFGGEMVLVAPQGKVTLP